jgi:hypothetical protein
MLEFFDKINVLVFKLNSKRRSVWNGTGEIDIILKIPVKADKVQIWKAECIYVGSDEHIDEFVLFKTEGKGQ